MVAQTAPGRATPPAPTPFEEYSFESEEAGPKPVPRRQAYATPGPDLTAFTFEAEGEKDNAPAKKVANVTVVPSEWEDVKQQQELHALRRHMKRAAELTQRFPDLLRDPEIDAAANVIADARARASPAPTAIARDRAAPAFAAAVRTGRATWSDEMKKTKAEGRRNPAQFIREEYALELSAGILTRDGLPQIDYALAKAYASWIRPARHPEDAVWPEHDGKQREHKQRLAKMTKSERVEYERSLDAKHQATYAAQFRHSG
jgi:hypothetical protein